MAGTQVSTIHQLGPLPPRIGRFQLQAHNNLVPLVWLGHDHPVNNGNIESVVLSRMAFFVPHAHIPDNLSAPFHAAGEKYAADFDRYCRTLIFLPELAIGDPRHEMAAAGFSLAALSDVPPEFKSDYQETIFHCPVNEEGELKDDQIIHWELSALIGQAKIGHLAIAQQLSLSERGPEAFALMYQRSIIKELIARDFGDERYRLACGYFISGLNAMISSCRIAKPEEVALVERLEISGAAAK